MLDINYLLKIINELSNINKDSNIIIGRQANIGLWVSFSLTLNVGLNLWKNVNHMTVK